MNRSIVGLLFTAAVLHGAVAQAEGTLPPHIQRFIKRMVGTSDSLGVVTVQGSAGKAELRVEQALMGALPVEQVFSSAGIAREDLKPGTRLLVPFRKAGETLVPYTAQYELIAAGRIREYPASVFLHAVEKEVALKAVSASLRTRGPRMMLAKQ
jgi:hypothetical protein